MKTLRLLSVFALTLFVGLATVNCGGDDKEEPTPTPADKSALTTKIADAKAIRDVSTQGSDPGQYPAAVMTAFNTAISAAETVKNNASATQEQVNAAVTALATAITTFQAGVVPAPSVNKAALESALTAANTVYTGATVGYSTGNYRKADKDAFGVILLAAKAVYDDANALQSAVDAQVPLVNNAKTAFQGKALTQDYDQYLSLHLKMDGNVTDASYYQQTAALNAGESSNPALTSDRNGSSNKAYLFNGGYISVPTTAASMRPSAASIAFWVNTTENAPSDRAVISMNWWDGLIVKHIGKQLFLQTHNAGGAYVGTWTEFTPGTWFHVVVTANNSKLQIYVNGALDNECDFTAAPLVIPETQPLTIGVLSVENGYYSFMGALDEFRFYSKVLSAAEALAIYNAEKP